MTWLMRLMGTTNNGEVDAHGQQRVIPYDGAGNSLVPLNRAAISETIAGLLQGGRDYKIARTARMSPSGAQSISGLETVLLNDVFEGTTRNLNQWVETATTMTSAQTTAVGLTLNSGSTTTANTGILQSSHRHMPLCLGTGLLGRWHLRALGATNCAQEWGFSDQTSATAATHANGAFFRRDGAGSLQPVLAFNGVETQGAVMSGFETTHYNTYSIFLESHRATFEVHNHQGVLLASQVMEIGASGGGAGSLTQARMFTVTHIPAFMRVLNTGVAGTAPQIIVNKVSVMLVDAWSQRRHEIQQSGQGYNSLTSPLTFTQLANWANNAAPTTRTLSNTAAAETTLGGLLRVNSIAGGNTDYIMFGWQNPSPYTFYCDGVWIPPPLNEGAAVATTPTIFSYFMAFNSSAVSLATAAPYSPMRVALPGIHHAPVNLAANALFSGDPIIMRFPTPYAVQPGRFLHIGCREWVGTATASETYLWAGVGVSGFFE